MTIDNSLLAIPDPVIPTVDTSLGVNEANTVKNEGKEGTDSVI